MANLDSILKSRDITYFTNKGPSSQSYGFSSSHVWMWELDYKESWALKNWCFWTVVWDKTLESPLDCKEIKLVNPKGNQSWIFNGRTDAEAETPILGHLMWRTNSLEKTLMLGMFESVRRKGWQRMRWLDVTTDARDIRFSSLQYLVDAQGILKCCSPWGHKELDRTERLNWLTELNNTSLVNRWLI